MKDHITLTISHVIGEFQIDYALLNLRISINLILLYVYNILDLGKILKVYLILLLAVRSICIPEGIMRVVLEKVNIFIIQSTLSYLIWRIVYMLRKVYLLYLAYFFIYHTSKHQLSFKRYIY